MKNKRREFLKQTAFTSLGIAGSGILKGFAADNHIFANSNIASVENKKFNDQKLIKKLFEKNLSKWFN